MKDIETCENVNLNIILQKCYQTILNSKQSLYLSVFIVTIINDFDVVINNLNDKKTSDNDSLQLAIFTASFKSAKLQMY